MNEEEWRLSVKAPDYRISNRGFVAKFGGEEVRPYKGTDGHLRVDLSIEAREYDYERHQWSRNMVTFFVWRLMIDTWFSGWKPGYEIYHLDGDKSNNAVDNLRARVYEERTGNMRMIGVRNNGYIYTFDRRLRGRVEIVEMSEVCLGVNAAAARVGGLASNVSHVLSGDLETHKGFHFRWVD